MFVTLGAIVALVSSLFQLWPSGDKHGQLAAKYQPITLAAMEGLFHTESGAPIVLVGQPDTDRQELDNPIYVPKALSFLTHRRWEAEVKGLNEFPRDRWPDNIPLLYYCYHIMVGLGTIFIAITVMAGFSFMEETTFPRPLDVMDLDVELSFSVHRQYRRMDHGGSGPTTLVGLRFVENRARLLVARFCR